MLLFIIISKFQCCYLVLAHKLPLAFQLISGKSQSLQWLAEFFHGLTSWYLCAHILVLTSKLSPHWTNNWPSCCSSNIRHVLSQGPYTCFFLHLIFTSSDIFMACLPSPLVWDLGYMIP